MKDRVGSRDNRNRKRTMPAASASEPSGQGGSSPHASSSKGSRGKRQRNNESDEEELDWLEAFLVPISDFPYLHSRMELVTAIIQRRTTINE